jgi:DNA-binding response OmpR family regulator
VVTRQKAWNVLIVEDEFLIAMHLENLLTEMGHRVVGTAVSLDEATKLARDGKIDIAVLDINLAGIQSFPVADILHERGIAFVFASGYGSEGLVDRYRHVITLRKPYHPQELEQAIAASLPTLSR